MSGPGPLSVSWDGSGAAVRACLLDPFVPLGAPMDTRTARVLTRARIGALALMAVAILGLAYLRFSPNPESISLPAGAKVGQLTLEPCSFPTEKGSYPADCGSLVVPDNRANPGSRLIALPVTRIRAHAAHPGEPIFYLEGGPGLAGPSRL